MTVMAKLARAALVLAAVAESEPVSRSEPERGPYCEDVRVHDFHGDNEGYGNQMHALIMAAEMAVPCNMTLLIPMKGRFGHICSRLGCDAPFVRRRDFGAGPADFEVNYQRGFGARCQVKRARPCRFRHAHCLERADADPMVKTDAIREVLALQSRVAPTCSDGAPPPESFDVTVHFRAITTAFEGRDEALFRMDSAQMKKHEAGEDPSLDESPWAAYTDLPPFEEVAKPVVDYLEREGLRKKIFLAGNVPAAKAAVAARFVDAGVVVCAVDADADVVRHPNKLADDNLDMRNDPSLCDDCLDVTFGEWSYLAKATKLVVQLGMHCVGDGDCLDPRERIYGRRSSFSLSAATFAAVPSTIIVDPAAPLDPADFTPPGYRPPKGVGGLSMSCSLQPAMDAMRAGRRRR